MAQFGAENRDTCGPGEDVKLEPGVGSGRRKISFEEISHDTSTAVLFAAGRKVFRGIF